MTSHKLKRRSILCSKIVLLIFNCGFFVAGLVVVVAGVWCLGGMGKEILVALSPGPPTPPTLVHLSYGLTAVGGLILLVGTLGTWAAIKENKCGLGVYLTFVSLVIVGEVSLGVLAVLYQARATADVSSSLRARLQGNYAAQRYDAFTNAIDYVQYQLMCCGIDSPDDWMDSRWKRDQTGGPDRAVPLTCCALHRSATAYLNPSPVNEAFCQSNVTDENSIARHSQGCIERVQNWIRAESGLITGVGVGVALLQVAGLIASASLCRSTLAAASSD